MARGKVPNRYRDGAAVDHPDTQHQNNQHHLLAIDLGLKCGMALYDAQGRLVSYRSLAYGSVAQLKRAAARILAELSDLAWIVTEGDVTLAAIWERAAMKQGVRVQRVSAEAWRQALLVPHQRTCVNAAKKHARIIARTVIDRSLSQPQATLAPDAAEAICVGLWAVGRLGLLADGLAPGALRARASGQQAKSAAS